MRLLIELTNGKRILEMDVRKIDVVDGRVKWKAKTGGADFPADQIAWCRVEPDAKMGGL